MKKKILVLELSKKNSRPTQIKSPPPQLFIGQSKHVINEKVSLLIVKSELIILFL